MSEQKFNKYKYLDYLNNGPDGDMLYYTFYRFNNRVGALVTSDYMCKVYNISLLLFDNDHNNDYQITYTKEGIELDSIIKSLDYMLELIDKELK